jgi:hypothetical protein
VTVPEWTHFKIGVLETSKENHSCIVLNKVFHVAHIETALSILRDEQITVRPVSDKSKLKSRGIPVVWLSPNNWKAGFRYGNVRFTFAWREIIRNKNYYWVESIAYGVPACRILVTSKDYSGTLQSYDPTLGDGPWWYDSSSDQHYWNGEYCLEIMLERNLYITECMGIDFVDHHQEYCSTIPDKCIYLGVPSDRASRLFLASLVVEEITSKNLISPATLKEICIDLRNELTCLVDSYSDKVMYKKSDLLLLARSVLHNYLKADQKDLLQSLSLFSSRQTLIASVTEVIESNFYIRCDFCGGKGEIGCSRCHGDGVIPCPSCDGYGVGQHNPCWKCDGQGVLCCPTCGGGGFVRCPWCHGVGAIRYFECD